MGFIPDSADYETLDYLTSNLFNLYMGVVIKQPSHTDRNVINYADPLPRNVWLALLMLWLTTCILTTLSDIEEKGLRQKVISIFMKIVMLKDVTLSNSSLASLRIAVATYLFYTVIISNIYDSLLISNVSVYKNMKHYKTLEDLLRAEIEFCTQAQSNYIPIIEDMNQQPFIKLFKKLKGNTEISKPKDGYRKVLKENYAFIENSFDAMHGIKHLCELELLPTQYFPSAINNGNQSREHWFDRDYKKDKRNVRRLLYKFRRSKNVSDRITYTKAKKNLRRLYQSKKKEREQKIWYTISTCKNTTKFWEEVNKFKLKKARKGQDIPLDDWKDHFMRVLNGRDSRVSANPHVEADKMISKQHEFLDRDFEEGEFRKTISQLKKRKTAGPDGIINEFYRAMSGEARSIVLKIVNDIWHKEEYPEKWRTGVIIPIFKAGETRDVGNYRGITLLNSLYKITTTMMAKRLQD
uniref:Ionotropic glutamate receptor C-terminal domain-containing protein n=1 Tax=Strigamia maritima TaxID=126957 RepID=T1IQG6_STRMM